MSVMSAVCMRKERIEDEYIVQGRASLTSHLYQPGRHKVELAPDVVSLAKGVVQAAFSGEGAMRAMESLSFCSLLLFACTSSLFQIGRY